MFTTPHWAQCCWESLSSGWMGFNVAMCTPRLVPPLKLPLTRCQLCMTLHDSSPVMILLYYSFFSSCNLCSVCLCFGCVGKKHKTKALTYDSAWYRTQWCFMTTESLLIIITFYTIMKGKVRYKYYWGFSFNLCAVLLCTIPTSTSI